MATVSQLSTVATIATTRLRASVSFVSPVVSVVCAQPEVSVRLEERDRLGIAVVKPTVNVTRQIPVAAISYIQLDIEAELDPLNRNPYLANAFLVVDSRIVEFGKTLADSTAISDAARLHAFKDEVDAVSTTDQILVAITFIRDFADSLGVSESSVIEFGKNLMDSLVVLEDRVLDLGKALADSPAISEALSYDLATELAGESVSVAEQILVAMLYVLNFADTVGNSDDSVIEFGKNLINAVLSQDQILSQDFAKALTDGVAMNDLADVGDGFEFQFEASFSNVAFVNDALAKALARALADQANIAEQAAIAFDQEPRQDSVSTSDYSDLDFGKNPDDTVTGSDLVSAIDTDKPLDDAPVVTEDLEKEFSADKADSAAVSDSAAKDVAPSLSDSGAISDAQAFDFDAQRADSISLSDLLAVLFSTAFSDTASVTDDLANSLAKSLIESVSSGDQSEIEFGASKSESVSVADAVSLFEVFKALSESASLTDTPTLEVGKEVSDSSSVTDALVLLIAAAFADSISTSEQATVLFDASRSESVTVSDTALLDVLKSFSDSISLSDASVLDVGKGLSDSPSVTDVLDVDGGYSLSDGVGMNDSFGFGFTYTTSFSNVAFVGDASVIVSGKGLSDSATPDDSGSLISQGYCDITYFAEDYVGDSRTFT